MLYRTQDLKNKRVEQLKEEISRMKNKPVLKVLLVGNDPASVTYTNNKQKLAEYVGINAETIHITENIEQSNLNRYIELISNSPDVDGVLLQLPLPQRLNADEALQYMNPEKDVDGLTLIQQGRLFSSKADMIPCTPKGILSILNNLGYNDLSGLDITVVGRSKLVGMPTAKLCQDLGATVTVCHSKTDNLREHTKHADILIVAVGKPQMIDSTYVSDKTQIVIDVGINRVDGKLCGDCQTQDIEDKYGKTCIITAVPGGVGPMTVVSLLENTLQSAKGK